MRTSALFTFASLALGISAAAFSSEADPNHIDGLDEIIRNIDTNAIALADIDKFGKPEVTGTSTINSVNNPGVYLGYKAFPSTDGAVNSCAAACLSATEYGLKKNLPVCKFFAAYVLNRQAGGAGPVIPQGSYCALYSTSYDLKFNTNSGQYRNGDKYTLTNGITYTLIGS